MTVLDDLLAKRDQLVLDALQVTGGDLTAAEVGAYTGLSTSEARATLKGLKAQGLVIQANSDRAYYSLAR